MQQVSEVLQFTVGFILSPFGIVGFLYYLNYQKNRKPQ